MWEFPLWHSRNKPDYYPWGHGFDPWTCSVGQRSGVAASCGVGRKCCLNLASLWLWRRLAAVASTWPLAWELPCAVGAALPLKKKPLQSVCTLKKKKKKKKKDKTKTTTQWEKVFADDMIRVWYPKYTNSTYNSIARKQTIQTKNE